MSGIRKSKEVYKFTDTERYGRVIVPVRGLYVSGLHTEPWYIDGMLNVTSFTSNKAKIRDYLETKTSNTFRSFSITAAESSQAEIVDYTSTRKANYLQSFSIVSTEASDITVLFYTATNKSNTFRTFSITAIESSDITVEQYSSEKVDSSLEHILSIEGYDASNCEITNYIS